MENLNKINEMSMMDLVHALYKKKLFVILSTVLGLAIGLAYLRFAHPVYEAKISLFAVTEGDIAGFNVGRSWYASPLKPVTVREVHQSFYSQLYSDAVKKDFLERFYFPVYAQSSKSEEQLRAEFDKNFALVEKPVNPAERYSKYIVSIRSTDPKQASLWLQQFVTVAREHSMALVLNNLQQQNNVMAANLQNKIDRLRAAAKAERNDYIAKLREKVTVARMKNAKTTYWDDEPAIMDDANEAAMNLDEMQSKLKKLAARKSDDAFIPKLRDLQVQLDFYKNLVINTDKVEVFHMDGVIDIPSAPISPKKRLVIMLSLISGFLLGVFGVLLQLAYRKEAL